MAGSLPNLTTAPGYRIERIYLIHCDRCNSEISRAEDGTDYGTLTEARKALHHHQQLHLQDDLLFPESPLA